MRTREEAARRRQVELQKQEEERKRQEEEKKRKWEADAPIREAAERKRQEEEKVRQEQATQRAAQLKLQQEAEKTRQEQQRRQREAQQRMDAASKRFVSLLPDLLKAGLGCIVVIWLALGFKNLRDGVVRSNAYHASHDSPSINASDIRMLSPAKPWIKTKVQGLWKGAYSNKPATLYIRGRQDNRFWGTLTVRSNRATYKISFKGVLADSNRVGIQETHILSGSRKAPWTLGLDNGSITNSDQTMSGVGRDNKGSVYAWSFNRSS